MTFGPAGRRVWLAGWRDRTTPLFVDELDRTLTAGDLERDLRLDYLDAFPDWPSDDLGEMASEDAATAFLVALVRQSLTNLERRGNG